MKFARGGWRARSKRRENTLLSANSPRPKWPASKGQKARGGAARRRRKGVSWTKRGVADEKGLGSFLLVPAAALCSRVHFC